MDVDTFVGDVLGCGLYQLTVYLTLLTVVMCYGWHYYFVVFASYDPGWSCSIPGNASSSNDSLYNYNLSRTMEISSTNIFNNSNNNVIINANNYSSNIVPGSCDVIDQCIDGSIVFHESRTLVTEFGLICDRAWIVPVIQSIDMAGSAFSNAIGGPILDRFGRKRPLIISLLLYLLIQGATLFSTNWQMLVSLRFLANIPCALLHMSRQLYLIEVSTSKWRVAVVSLPAWHISTLSFCVLAFLFKDWKSVQMAMVVASVVALVLCFWIPDTLRWLAVHGKSDQAKKVAAQMCRFNRKEMPSSSTLDLSASEGGESEKKANVLLLFRRNLFKQTLATCAILFLVALTYFSLFFGVRNLHGNFYINLILFNVLALPTSPFLPFISNKIGRRYTSFLFLSLSTLLCFCIVVLSFNITDDSVGPWVTTALALTISVCIDHGWATHLAHSSELFPTSLRGSALFLIRMSSSIAGIVAPYIIPGSRDHVYVYYIFNGVALCVSALTALSLKETNKMKMNDSLAQADKGEEPVTKATQFIEPLMDG